jgi:hypothetical protein
VHPGLPWDKLRFDAATVWSMPTMNSKLVSAKLVDPVVAHFNQRWRYCMDRREGRSERSPI